MDEGDCVSFERVKGVGGIIRFVQGVVDFYLARVTVMFFFLSISHCHSRRIAKTSSAENILQVSQTSIFLSFFMRFFLFFYFL